MNNSLRSVIELYHTTALADEHVVDVRESKISVSANSKIFNRVEVKRALLLHTTPKCIQDLSSIKKGGSLKLYFNNPEKICIISVSDEKEKINMLVRAKTESSIETETLLLPLQVCIGKVQMSVRDIIELNLGSVCSMNIPEQKSVQLLLGGEPIAEASLSLSENSINLKIIDVHLQLEEEKSDNSRDADEADCIAG
jgi:flagellar motor switch/type III secretory pathway protein FliN